MNKQTEKQSCRNMVARLAKLHRKNGFRGKAKHSIQRARKMKII